MRTNGTLRYCTFTEGGFNDDGEPIAGSEEWSDAIPCLIEVKTDSSDGIYEDGTFHQSSYEVLVEDGEVPLDVNRVRLVRGSVSLGDFEVQGRPLPTVMDRIKITV